MAEKLRILIVDDVEVVRKAYMRALSDEYDLVEAADGETAWDILNQDDDICAIFADSHMDHLDGQTLLKKLRTSENEDIKSLPFILVATESDDYQSKQAAMEAGATDFISKPFDTRFLQACARTYVRPNEKKLSYERNPILDPLTKLANKAYFFKRGMQEVAAATRHKISLAVILVNIDGFDELQNMQGNRATKGVLRKVGSYIASEVRLEDTVARIDRGLFAVLTSSTALEEVEIIAERIRERVNKKTIRYGEASLKVAMSLGAAVMQPYAYMDFDLLFVHAEKNLEQATAQGGDQLVVQTYGEPNESKDIVISLDRALRALQNQKSDLLQGQSEKLLRQLLPLLAHCNRELELSLDEVVTELEIRLHRH